MSGNTLEVIAVIYADNAATTQLDPDAFAAMRCFLLEKYGNASQAYSLGIEARKAIKASREKIAACIGADPEEIFFTSGGTESDNWAIKMGSGRDGDIITSAIEHHAVLRPCEIGAACRLCARIRDGGNQHCICSGKYNGTDSAAVFYVCK